MTEIATRQHLTELRAQFDKMLAANRGEPGAYNLAELAEVRLPLIGLELEELNAKLPALQADHQQTAQTLRVAEQAAIVAQQQLLAAQQANQQAWLVLLNHEKQIEQFTGERESIQQDLNPRRRTQKR